MQAIPKELSDMIERAIGGAIAAAGRSAPSPEFWSGVEAATIRFPFLAAHQALAFLAGAAVELGIEKERNRIRQIAEAAGDLKEHAIALMIGGDDVGDAIAWLVETAAEDRERAAADEKARAIEDGKVVPLR